jgi:hypothetical protein
MSNKEDWTFDLGTDDKGFFTVEAWASTIPNRTYSRLTREQLLQLRREINSALRRYPKPEAGARKERVR